MIATVGHSAISRAASRRQSYSGGERVRTQWEGKVKFVKPNLGDNSVRVNEKDDLADAASSAVLRPGLPTLATLFPRLFDSAYKGALLKRDRESLLILA